MPELVQGSGLTRHLGDCEVSVLCEACRAYQEGDAALIASSDALLQHLATGGRHPSNPHLGPGKRHLAALRRRGIVRHLDGPAMGLPVEFPEAFSRPTERGRYTVAFALWDELEWCVLECLERFDGISDVPVEPDGSRPLPYLTGLHIRAVMGWTQSYLDKYARDLYLIGRALTGALTVETIPFLQHVHHPQYPFMRRTALLYRRR